MCQAMISLNMNPIETFYTKNLNPGQTKWKRIIPYPWELQHATLQLLHFDVNRSKTMTPKQCQISQVGEGLKGALGWKEWTMPWAFLMLERMQARSRTGRGRLSCWMLMWICSGLLWVDSWLVVDWKARQEMNAEKAERRSRLWTRKDRRWSRLGFTVALRRRTDGRDWKRRGWMRGGRHGGCAAVCFGEGKRRDYVS